MEPEPICVNPKHGDNPQQTAVVTVTMEPSAFIEGTVTCKGRATHLALVLQHSLRLTASGSSQSCDICQSTHSFR